MYTMIQVHQVVVVKMYRGIGVPGYRSVHQYTTQTQLYRYVVHTYYSCFRLQPGLQSLLLNS